jgi:hypothetical protein
MRSFALSSGNNFLMKFTFGCFVRKTLPAVVTLNQTAISCRKETTTAATTNS